MEATSAALLSRLAERIKRHNRENRLEIQEGPD